MCVCVCFPDINEFIRDHRANCTVLAAVKEVNRFPSMKSDNHLEDFGMIHINTALELL